MTSLAPELVRLLDKFQSILDPLESFQRQLADEVLFHENWPLWAYKNASRTQIADFITSLEYTDDEDAGGTNILPAVIGLPASAFALIHDVNAARTALVDFLQEADKEYTADGFVLSRYLLRKAKLTRFNRKAVARQYVVLDTAPDSVSYMWSSNPTIKRITKKQALGVVARRMNQCRQDKKMQNALYLEDEVIKALPEDIELARVYPAVHPKVNTIINGQRMPVKTALMPMFYPAHQGEPLPELVPLPAVKEARTRIKRSDTRLEREPVAPLVNIYRYKR